LVALDKNVFVLQLCTVTQQWVRVLCAADQGRQPQLPQVHVIGCSYFFQCLHADTCASDACAAAPLDHCSSSNALSLLKGLLVRDPAQRLGSGPDGVAAIKRHAFFKGLSWSKLDARQLESKFKPGVKCSMVSVGWC
jgi:hypothetical protein